MSDTFLIASLLVILLIDLHLVDSNIEDLFWVWEFFFKV